jgi:methionyl-tRNA formyltransferase
LPLLTAFFGTSDFAAVILRALAASPYKPGLVVTPPDRPKGRGRRLQSPPAAIVARAVGVELVQAEGVNDAGPMDAIRAAGVDVGVVCAFGQLLREPLLSELEMLNIHPSLLPRWRGAAPIERAIMEGDSETGVTIMRVTEGLDSGPVALQRPVAIEPGEAFDSLSARLAELGAVLVLEALELRSRDELRLEPQDDEEATYAEKISPEERHLDPGLPAIDLERRVRALTPHVGAYLELDGGQRLGVREARAVETEGHHEPGRLVAIGDELRLGCGQGALLLLHVLPPGGREMQAGAYLRGHDPPERAI